MSNPALLGILAALAGLAAVWVAPLDAVAGRRMDESSQGNNIYLVAVGLVLIVIGGAALFAALAPPPLRHAA